MCLKYSHVINSEASNLSLCWRTF